MRARRCHAGIRRRISPHPSLLEGGRADGTPEADLRCVVVCGPPPACRTAFNQPRCIGRRTVRAQRSSAALPDQSDLCPHPCRHQRFGCGPRWQPTLRKGCPSLKRTDPQTPHSRRRAGGASGSSGMRTPPEEATPQTPPASPRTIPVIIRARSRAGGEGSMRVIRRGGDKILRPEKIHTSQILRGTHC